MNNKSQANAPLPAYYSKPQTKHGVRGMMDDKGNWVPSMTAIIEKTRSVETQAKLKAWRNQFDSTQQSQAIQRGIQGHRFLEAFWKGEMVDCPPLLQPYWNQLRSRLDGISNVRLVEGNLFHFYLGYGGRVDLVADFYEIPCVIEFKFCDRAKPIYEEIPLQLAAYAGALNRQYGKPYQIELNNAVLFVTTPDTVEITHFSPEEMQNDWQRWQRKVQGFWTRTEAA